LSEYQNFGDFQTRLESREHLKVWILWDYWVGCVKMSAIFWPDAESGD